MDPTRHKTNILIINSTTYTFEYRRDKEAAIIALQTFQVSGENYAVAKGLARWVEMRHPRISTSDLDLILMHHRLWEIIHQAALVHNSRERHREHRNDQWIANINGKYAYYQLIKKEGGTLDDARFNFRFQRKRPTHKRKDVA